MNVIDQASGEKQNNLPSYGSNAVSIVFVELAGERHEIHGSF